MVSFQDLVSLTQQQTRVKYPCRWRSISV